MHYSYSGNLGQRKANVKPLSGSHPLTGSFFILEICLSRNESVVMTSSAPLTMSCVKAETSTVELSGCLVTRRPSLGCRITLNVMTRLEALLMSLVAARKSSFVIGVEEPGDRCKFEHGGVTDCSLNN